MKQEPIPRSDAGLATVAPDALGHAIALDYIRSNAKPPSTWRIGLEYELFGFERGSYQRLDRLRVQELLRALVDDQGVAVLEGSHIVALHMPYGDITLEPGGQIEFSGSPAITLVEAEAGFRRFLRALHAHAAERAIFFVAMGFDPLRTLSEQFWIAKRRYAIMRPYLRRRGGHAWDMMTRTAAMQTSIDYGDDEDLGRKYVLGNRIGPIIAAMFANSPFADGAPTGLKSTRYAVWLDTDPDRTGAAPSTLSGDFDLDAAAHDILDVPLFFVEREGKLINLAGRRLRDLHEGATRDDFKGLLSMVFTEARIREYIEMRSADGGAPDSALALLAFWKGLTYHAPTLDAALSIAPQLEASAYRSLQMSVARHALATRCEGVDVLSVARALVTLAREGLEAIAPGELHLLDRLAQNVIEDGVAPADILLRDCGDNVERAMAVSTVA